MSARTRVVILALAFTTPASLQSQWVGAVRGWFSTPGCEPAPALDSANGERRENGEQPKLASRVHELTRSIPEGLARDLAQQLAAALSPRTHLQTVCKDATETGYVIRYPSNAKSEFVSDGEVRELRYEFPNLGRPKIRFDAVVDPEAGLYRYSYILSNHIDATRPIWSWYLVTESEDDSLQIHNSIDWRNRESSSSVAPQSALYENLQGPELMIREPLGKLIWWRGEQHIQPGQTVGNFTLESSFLPGWTTAYVQSHGIFTTLPRYWNGFPSESLDKIMEEIEFLDRWENRQSSIPVIGPRFSPTTTKGEMSSNWVNGIRIMIKHGWLQADSPYVTELLEFLNDPSTGALNSHMRAMPMEGMEALLDRIVRMTF